MTDQNGLVAVPPRGLQFVDGEDILLFELVGQVIKCRVVEIVGCTIREETHNERIRFAVLAAIS